MIPTRLAIVATHPIQYQCPVWRLLASPPDGLDVRVYFASDFSIRGYEDRGFSRQVRWEQSLLAGFESRSFSRRPINHLLHLASRRMVSEIIDWNPDACLVNAYLPLMYLRMIVACNRSGIPVVMRAETTDADRSRSRLAGWMRDALLRRLYRRISAFAAIGQNSESHYRRLGVASDRLAFAPYCVDTEAFERRRSHAQRGRERQRLRVPQDALVLLFSGKLIPKKDPMVLLSAVQDVETVEGRPVYVWFMGDGELRSALVDFADRRVPGRVRFLGFLPQDQLGDVYADADMLVMPSRLRETWGLVVNEALMFGLPCVVSDRVGCAPDLIAPGKTGFVFPHGNAEALRSAIIHIATALVGSRTEVAAQCRERVGSYSARAAADGIVAAIAIARGQVLDGGADSLMGPARRP